MKGKPKASKLKRDRKESSEATENHLFGDGSVVRIETRSATSDDPVLRRFIPRFIPCEEHDGSDLERLNILDWRDKPFSAGDKLEPEDVQNRIICADAEKALKGLPKESIRCIVTSPPYWNVVDYGFDGQLGFCSYEEYLLQLLSVWSECERVLAPNGKLCITAPVMPISKKVIPGQHTRHLKNISNDIEASILGNLALKRFSIYIWQKQTTEKMFGSYPYPPNLYEHNTVEFINVFVKDGKPAKVEKEVKEASRISEKEWMNLTRQVWPLYPEDVKRAKHPAPFPESLPNRLIAMYTFGQHPESGFEGDLVLDPFNGTGSTTVAAKRLGRRYIGVDLSPDFCIMAQLRLKDTATDGRISMIDDKRAPSEEFAPPRLNFEKAECKRNGCCENKRF